MGYYDCYYHPRRPPSIFDGFCLKPLPYPVLLILVIISVFLAIKFYFVSEEAAEAAEFQINWLLLAAPLLLIFAVKLLSSFQDRRWPYGGGYPGKWCPTKCRCFECRGSCVTPVVPIYRPC